MRPALKLWSLTRERKAGGVAIETSGKERLPMFGRQRRDSNVIDRVARDPSGTIVLILVETRPWGGSPRRLRELQDRLNACYAYISTGQLAERFPEAAGSPLKIQLDTLEPPDAETQQVLAEVERSLHEEGIAFEVNQLSAAST
jgi:hypothetical protein